MPTLFTSLVRHGKRETLSVEALEQLSLDDSALAPTVKALKGSTVRRRTGAFKTIRRARAPTPRLSLADRFEVLRNDAPSKKIVVVGGGLAGLSAAYELESVGYEVEVFEAQAEVGGRTRSNRSLLPGKVLEEGAELIGLNHLAWWSYKRKFRLQLHKVADPSEPPVILRGTRFVGHAAVALMMEMQNAQDLIDRAARDVNADEPWKSRDAKRLDSMSLTQALKALPLSPLCRLAFREQLQADNGVPANLQSWLGNLAMIKGGGGSRYWTDTETHRCRGGSQELALSFAAGLRLLRCSNPVREIQIDGKVVRVLPTRGRPVVCDDVILAVPPTLWRSIRVTPSLKPWSGVQFGKNVKYLLDVRQDAWAPESAELSTDGPVDLTWEGTYGQSGPRAGFVGFSGATDAVTWAKWRRKKERFLREMDGVYPGLQRGCRNGKFVDWPNNPWTHGSYSFPKPGEVMRMGAFLRAPFQRHLHFAGEHTCYAFVGYMEGALRSGLRVAEFLARRDGVIR